MFSKCVFFPCVFTNSFLFFDVFCQIPGLILKTPGIIVYIFYIGTLILCKMDPNTELQQSSPHEPSRALNICVYKLNSHGSTQCNCIQFHPVARPTARAGRAQLNSGTMRTNNTRNRLYIKGNLKLAVTRKQCIVGQK